MVLITKKLQRFCMTFAFLMFCFLANTQLTHAGTNSSQQASETINVNQAMEGVMDSDYSWFVTKLTQSGIFYVDFNRASEDGDRYSNAGWKLSVYVNNRFILDNHYIAESSSAYTSPYYAYPAGTKVYIRIQNAGAGTNVPYRFNLINKASSTWESESNDTKAKADIISVNKFYKGNFAKGDTLDYYKAKLTKTGYTQLVFGRLSPDGDRYTNAGWKVSLMVGGKFILDSAVITENEALNGYRSPLFGYQKGQTIYIRIENWGAGNNVDYKFCLKNTASSVWESESNNTRNAADSIKMNKAYFGNFHTADSVDFYAVKAAKTGTFRISFGRRQDTGDRYSNAGWKVSVFVDKKKVLDSKYVTEEAALNGYLSGRFKVKKGQKITVMVEDYGASNHVDYKLAVKM